MKKSELRKMIKEEIRKLIKENKISDKLYDSIFKNHYKTVEVSLKYAKKAGDIFRDSFKNAGRMISTNVFHFKNEEDTTDFIDNLIQHLNMPEDEISLEK